jgi:hypothetical protein
MAENVVGSVDHAVLDRFLKALKNTGGPLSPLEKGELPGPYRALLADCTEAVFAALPNLPNERLAISALTTRLLRAEQQSVLKQLEVLFTAFLQYFAGFTVAGSELTYNATGEQYYLSGIIDCMLEYPRDDPVNEGTGVIVDFKLFSTPDRKQCTGAGETGLEDFQLPMYLTLAEANGSKPVHTALFFSILQAEPKVVFGTIRDSRTGRETPYRKADRIERTGSADDRFTAIMSEFTARAKQYAAEVSSGSFSVIGNESTCAACEYHRVCRTIYTVDRERGLLKPTAVVAAAQGGVR